MTRSLSSTRISPVSASCSRISDQIEDSCPASRRTLNPPSKAALKTVDFDPTMHRCTLNVFVAVMILQSDHSPVSRSLSEAVRCRARPCFSACNLPWKPPVSPLVGVG